MLLYFFRIRLINNEFLQTCLKFKSIWHFKNRAQWPFGLKKSNRYLYKCLNSIQKNKKMPDDVSHTINPYFIILNLSELKIP